MWPVYYNYYYYFDINFLAFLNKNLKISRIFTRKKKLPNFPNFFAEKWRKIPTPKKPLDPAQMSVTDTYCQWY
jgi:hypothetical protein